MKTAISYILVIGGLLIFAGLVRRDAKNGFNEQLEVFEKKFETQDSIWEQVNRRFGEENKAWKKQNDIDILFKSEIERLTGRTLKLKK